jgi:hypothetical protein
MATTHCAFQSLSGQKGTPMATLYVAEFSRLLTDADGKTVSIMRAVSHWSVFSDQ